jgi:hypothetical protein
MVGDFVKVGEEVSGAVWEGVEVCVSVGLCVEEWEDVGVEITVEVGVKEGIGSIVTVAVEVAVGDTVGVGVSVSEPLGVEVSNAVGVKDGSAPCQPSRRSRSMDGDALAGGAYHRDNNLNKSSESSFRLLSRSNGSN